MGYSAGRLAHLEMTVLRFRLMRDVVWVALPQHQKGEEQHDAFCRSRRLDQGGWPRGVYRSSALRLATPSPRGAGQNDTRGSAQMMRVNFYWQVHVKTLRSQHRRALLTARSPRSSPAVSRCATARRASSPVVGNGERGQVYRRMMTIPGIGPVVALAFTATIDVPARFRTARSVGPALGLTPVLHQSGESSRIGCVLTCGDAMLRGLLYETVQVLLTGSRDGPGSKLGRSRWRSAAASDGRSWRWRAGSRSSCIVCGPTARTFAGPGRPARPPERRPRRRRAEKRKGGDCEIRPGG